MRRAIIADDESLAAELIKHLLDKYGLPVKIVGEASAGDDAVEMIYQLKPDIVFLDIQMPVLSGIEVMENINASYQGTILFVVITAFSYFEYAQAALRLGAKDILLKPIEPKQFLDTMERVIGYRYTENEAFNEFLEYIHQHYHEAIELNICAKRHHTSMSHISRMFQKYFQTNFTAYVNHLRIKKAQEFLKETTLSIQEIADKVGYNNLNYFYKNFKKVTGMTPNLYRGKGS